MTNLSNKKIVLGITGGIAAYKCAELVRRLKDVGCEVKVVMNESAKHFITPLTLYNSINHASSERRDSV